MTWRPRSCDAGLVWRCFGPISIPDVGESSLLTLRLFRKRLWPWSIVFVVCHEWKNLCLLACVLLAFVSHHYSCYYSCSHFCFLVFSVRSYCLRCFNFFFRCFSNYLGWFCARFLLVGPTLSLPSCYRDWLRTSWCFKLTSQICVPHSSSLWWVPSFISLLRWYVAVVSAFVSYWWVNSWYGLCLVARWFPVMTVGQR